MDSAPDVYVLHGLLSREVEATLSAIDFDPKDAGLRRLAEIYAGRIDNARSVAHVAEYVLGLAKQGNRLDIELLVKALQAKVDEQTTLKDIGARLEATLAALGASPSARAKLEAPTQPRQSRLQAFRGGA